MMTPEQARHFLAGVPCDANNYRDVCRNPWGGLGGTFATDARSIAWAAHALDAPAYEGKYLAAAEGFLRTPGEARRHARLADVLAWCGPHEEAPPCPECKGVPPKPCRECGGEGYVECDYGHEHVCPECDGASWCRACRGTGKAALPERLGGCHGGVYDLRRLAALLCRLPDPGEPVTVHRWGGMLRVEGDGWSLATTCMEGTPPPGLPALHMEGGDA